MKKQMKFEKIVSFLVLAACAISFFLSLGLMTDIYNARLADEMYFSPGKTISGGLFEQLQPINSKLVMGCLIMIVISLLLFITKTNSRRRYYISNYIAVGVVSTLCIAISIWAMINLFEVRNLYLTKIDFTEWAIISKKYVSITYNSSSFWIDINIIAIVLVIICIILLLGNLIWKVTLMKAETDLLSNKIYLQQDKEVNIDE